MKGKFIFYTLLVCLVITTFSWGRLLSSGSNIGSSSSSGHGSGSTWSSSSNTGGSYGGGGGHK